MSIFEPAQTPIPLITYCYFCGGAGVRDDMVWYGGIGGILLHTNCEEVLKKRGVIYYRWTSGMNTSRQAIEDESKRMFGTTSPYSPEMKLLRANPHPA